MSQFILKTEKPTVYSAIQLYNTAANLDQVMLFCITSRISIEFDGKDSKLSVKGLDDKTYSVVSKGDWILVTGGGKTVSVISDSKLKANFESTNSI